MHSLYPVYIATKANQDSRPSLSTSFDAIIVVTQCGPDESITVNKSNVGNAASISKAQNLNDLYGNGGGDHRRRILELLEWFLVSY